MKRDQVTVFGGSGFVGRHLVQELASRGYRIKVAVRSPQRAKYLLPLGDVGQISPVFCNILNEDSVNKALDKSEIAINLVGILSKRGKNTFHSIHFEGLERLAKQAIRNGVASFIHVSSLGAASSSPSESQKFKYLGEESLKKCFPDATILRPSLIFGHEDGFLCRFASLAQLLPGLPLFGKSFFNCGNNLYQPVFIGDVIKSIISCLEDNSTKGKTYELGGPKIYSFKELMQMVLSVTGRKRFLFPLPNQNAYILALFFELLPSFLFGTLFSRDQVKQLNLDNVVNSNALQLHNLGIKSTPLESVISDMLKRFTRDSVDKTA
tara:strand:- start:1853 stop:2821 length:969 start_codon:yes stop_codon:yes gene_type:complete